MSVLLSTGSTEFARRLRVANDDNLIVIGPGQLPAEPAQLLALTPEPEAIEAVVIDVRGGGDQTELALHLAAQFEQQYPGVGILLVGDDAARLALPALRSGVRDVLDAEADVTDLRWALRRAREAGSRSTGSGGPSAQDTYGGRVITVASPKGGVGKTTVATNIARALAQQSSGGVVIVDLDIQFGDVAAALDLDPDYTVRDIFAGAALDDAIALKTLLATHSSGLQVVCGVASPADADALTPERVNRLLQVLRHEYRYVVIDTSPGLSETTLAALDHTTDLVLVTSLDVPGVRGLRKEIAVLDQLAMHPHTRHVVVNNAERISGLSVADVEATISRRVDVVLPRSAAVIRSTNIGSPVVESSPRDKVSKDLLKLAGRFAPTASHGERTRWRGTQP